MKRRWVFMVGCIVIAIATADNGQQIQQLDQQISHLQTELQKTALERNRATHSLKRTEIEIQNIETHLDTTHKKLSEENDILTQLLSQQEKLKAQLAAQEESLQEQLRAAYTLGREPYLKMILDEKDPNTVSRALTYYEYLNQERLSVIEHIQKTLSELQHNQEIIEHKHHQLLALTQQQLHTKQQLEEAQQARQSVIIASNHALENEQVRLNQLIKNKKALDAALHAIRRKAMIIPSFQPSRGILPHALLWPTRGKIISRFDTPIEHSQLKWQGILIGAPLKQPVQAVADGEVVFADWMTGYGFLIIIDHGRGLMSLYGRNQDLLKKVGEKVRAGETIAQVGMSGGYETSALYFGLRQNSKSVDPLLWLK